MAIPKIIHYCWFGPKEIPAMELQCIESWKKYLPDYELKCWNERTFDINKYPFAKQAYERKYYAFVSDFVRTLVLKEYGGLYLDTDVEILSDLSPLLDSEVVLGFENRTCIGTALMAFPPNHPIMAEFFEFYMEHPFITENNQVNIIANPTILATILKDYNIIFKGEEQLINNEIHIYHRDVFFPKQMSKDEFRVTKETVAIHRFSGSWLTERQKKRGTNKYWINVCRPILKSFKNFIAHLVGEERTKALEIKIRNILR